MKKLLAIIMLAAISVASFSEVTRTGVIRTGGNILNKMTFTTADSVVTSDTLSITIANIQSYQQHFTATYTLDSLSGNPSIGVTLYGKTTSNGSWTSIGTATWDDVADNPQSISSTAPAHYNWLKLEFIASSTTQESRILTLDVRTSNAINLPSNSGTLTISRATSGTVTITSADNDANAALTVSAGGTGALSLGGGSGTVAVNSSAWDVTTSGVASGLTKITTTYDGDNVIIDPAADLQVLDIQVNSASVFNVDSTGLVTPLYYKFGTVVTNTDASETLSAAQSGALVVATAAGGATTITIPDASAATVGVIYYIMQTADQNLVVTATTADSNDLVCDGVATSDNVTISTAGHKIGAGMIVIGISATKWYVGGLNPESVLTPEAAD